MRPPARITCSRGTAIVVVGAALVLAPSSGAADGARAADGVWLVEDGEARVELGPCDDPGKLCGSIVWMRDPLDERGLPRRDVKNPDPALRDRAVLGLRILEGFERGAGADGVWSGGRVYDPKSGRTYRGTIRLEPDGRLKLRGYVLIPLFGRTATWTRVPPEDARPPAGAQSRRTRSERSSRTSAVPNPVRRDRT